MEQQKNRSILLVDDVELFLELEKTFFHRERFDLLMAVNAEEVMQLVLQRKPDLVFMDMHLSGARGDDVCRWIKQDPELQSIPVIMVVDAGDQEAESLCRQAGCDAIIQSPVKRQQLLSVARNVLDLIDRQQPRIPARMLVQFGNRNSREKVSNNYTVNLSKGGIFVATQDILPVGSPLSLQIQFPGQHDTISCEGRVAWLNHSEFFKKPHLPTGMGVEFNELTELNRGLVDSYLSRKLV